MMTKFVSRSALLAAFLALSAVDNNNGATAFVAPMLNNSPANLVSRANSNAHVLNSYWVRPESEDDRRLAESEQRDRVLEAARRRGAERAADADAQAAAAEEARRADEELMLAKARGSYEAKREAERLKLEEEEATRLAREELLARRSQDLAVSKAEEEARRLGRAEESRRRLAEEARKRGEEAARHAAEVEEALRAREEARERLLTERSQALKREVGQ